MCHFNDRFYRAVFCLLRFFLSRNVVNLLIKKYTKMIGRIAFWKYQGLAYSRTSCTLCVLISHFQIQFSRSFKYILAQVGE